MNRVVSNGLFIAGLALAGVVVAGWSGTAFAQQPQGQELRDRLNRLERDLRALNREVYRGALPKPGATTPSGTGDARPSRPPPTPGSTAFASRIGQRLSQLEADLQAVTGSVEKMAHDVGQISQRLDKLVGDVDFRLTRLESGARPALAQPGQLRPGQQGGNPAAGLAPPRLNAAPPIAGVQQVGPPSGGTVVGTGGQSLGTISGRDLRAVAPGSAPQASGSAPGTAQGTPGVMASAPPVAQPPAKATVLPTGTPQERYKFAFSLLRRADYTKAAAAFQEFIDAHPKSDLTPNARYWLGETFYVRGIYTQAADIFLSGYQSTPNGQKAPDSLLKLGMSLIALDKKREACATFDKLNGDFPNAPKNIQRVVERQRKRAACSAGS